MYIAWAEQGIVGRGVLVDYHGWRTSAEGQERSKVKDYDSFKSVGIPLEDLQACLEAQGTELKFGDILFIRSGKRELSFTHPLNIHLLNYLLTCLHPFTHTL